MHSASIQNKKFKKYRLNRSYRSQIDIFGTILKKMKINKSFINVYSSFFRKLQKRSNNIFLRLENSRNFLGFNKKNLKLRVYYNSKGLLRFYKNLKKRQFYLYYIKARKQREDFLNSFISLLELRLDMLLYRSFNFLTLSFLNQFLLHQGILINGRLVKSTNFQLKVGDIIHFKHLMGSTQLNLFYLMFKYKLNQFNRKNILLKYPRYLEVNYKFMLIKIIEKPKVRDLSFFNINYNFNNLLHKS